MLGGDLQDSTTPYRYKALDVLYGSCLGTKKETCDIVGNSEHGISQNTVTTRLLSCTFFNLINMCRFIHCN